MYKELHIQPFGSFLDSVSDQSTAEVGHTGGVITTLWGSTTTTTLVPNHHVQFTSKNYENQN